MPAAPKLPATLVFAVSAASPAGLAEIRRRIQLDYSPITASHAIAKDDGSHCEILVLSRGVSEVELPDFVGPARRTAQSIAADTGVKVEIVPGCAAGDKLVMGYDVEGPHRLAVLGGAHLELAILWDDEGSALCFPWSPEWLAGDDAVEFIAANALGGPDDEARA